MVQISEIKQEDDVSSEEATLAASLIAGVPKWRNEKSGKRNPIWRKNPAEMLS